MADRPPWSFDRAAFLWCSARLLAVRVVSAALRYLLMHNDALRQREDQSESASKLFFWLGLRRRPTRFAFTGWRRRPESSAWTRTRLSCVLLVSYWPLAGRFCPTLALDCFLRCRRAQDVVKHTTDHSLDYRIPALAVTAASSRPSHTTAQLKCLRQGSVACASDLSLKRSQAISLQ